MQDYNANGLAGASADNSDSDDYDPSTTLHEDFSVPFDLSEEMSPAAAPSASASVDLPVSHALPPAMNDRPSSTIHTQAPVASNQFSTSNTPSQNQPRTKGGFVVDDDDDDEDDNDDEDAKDILDVYETPDEPKVDALAPASVPQDLVNSSSTAPVPMHDAVKSPVQGNPVSNGASGVSLPSNLPNSDVVAQRGSTVTPIQTSSAPHTNVVPVPNSVNATPTSAGPKTRLAHDTIGILEDRIKEDPRGDMTAWLELINELKSRNKNEEVRRTYDEFFKMFPLAVSSLQMSSICRSQLITNRLSNGLHTLSGKTKIPRSSTWSKYSTGLCWPSPTLSYGQSISTTSDVETA